MTPANDDDASHFARLILLGERLGDAELRALARAFLNAIARERSRELDAPRRTQ